MEPEESRLRFSAVSRFDRRSTGFWPAAGGVLGEELLDYVCTNVTQGKMYSIIAARLPKAQTRTL